MVLRKDELEVQLKTESELIKSGILREENPLDLTEEFNDFLEACRRGDLKTCQELISAGVNINGKDKFDYTPLIIVRPRQSSRFGGNPMANIWYLKASLCGHYELVQLLLESGTQIIFCRTIDSPSEPAVQAPITYSTEPHHHIWRYRSLLGRRPVLRRFLSLFTATCIPSEFSPKTARWE